MHREINRNEKKIDKRLTVLVNISGQRSGTQSCTDRIQDDERDRDQIAPKLKLLKQQMVIHLGLDHIEFAVVFKMDMLILTQFSGPLQNCDSNCLDPTKL
jgi:hypothetical protein